MGMQIRKAKEHDLDSIFSLICELEENQIDKNHFCTVYINNLSDINIFYIVAEEHGEVVGFASMHIQQLLHHVGRIAEIQELIVINQYRGFGIGYMLTKELKSIAVNYNCINIEVCCNRMREESHTFYKKLGMKKSHFKFTLQISTI